MNAQESLQANYLKKRSQMLKTGASERAVDRLFSTGARKFQARGNVGAQHSSAPPTGCGPWGAVSKGAGISNPNCPPMIPKCECQIMSENTVGTTGLLAGGAANLPLGFSSGDCASFQPFYLTMIAFQISGTDNDQIANCDPCPFLLIDSQTGRTANLRKGGNVSDGLNSFLMGDQREIPCVDWMAWTSQTNMQLTMTLAGITTFATHVFISFWGSCA